MEKRWDVFTTGSTYRRNIRRIMTFMIDLDQIFRRAGAMIVQAPLRNPKQEQGVLKSVLEEATTER